MFPDIEYNNEDIDCSQEQIFDLRDKQYVGRYIKRLSDYNKGKVSRKEVLVVYPSNDDVDKIVSLLRHNFDKAVPLKTKIEYAEENLINLTNEQYKVIVGLSYNKRCLINGPAGTGKTVLAIKNVKESELQINNVGLFCYNLLLQKELRTHFKNEEYKPIYIGSFTDFLEKLVERYTDFDFKTIEDFGKFYKEDLPILAIEELEKNPIQFDKIIIDEAQDLMRRDYIEIIDIILKGGLKSGNWFFFGDFNLQTIYNKDIDQDHVIEILNEYSNFAVFNLSVNCRNTINIQREMNKIVNINYDSLKKDKNTPDVKYIQFNDHEDEVLLLELEIDKLLESGIKKSDITILSPFKFEKSVVSAMKKYQVDLCNKETQNITYSTIQGFKGLENKVIILTDIMTYNKPDLMYVAMSRARTLLYIFETHHAKKYRSKI